MQWNEKRRKVKRTPGAWEYDDVITAQVAQTIDGLARDTLPRCTGKNIL